MTNSGGARGRNICSPIEECPLHPGITIFLVRATRKKNHAWWPKEQSRPYAAEPYSAELTDSCDDAKLDVTGQMRKPDIPAGLCSIHFNKFYEEIENISFRGFGVPNE